MEWVASTLHTTSEHGVSSITTADAHTSAASSRLDAPAFLNGLVRFAERRNMVSARVPSHFKRSLRTVTDELSTVNSDRQTSHTLGGGPTSTLTTDYLKDGGIWFLRNVRKFLSVYTAPSSRRQ
jgi:hypothetical protein